jgi:hypothetical protein
MNKKLYISILILILTTLFAYGQQLLFQKNVNPSAIELLHNLNKEGDSLVLVSKTNPILQVDIFNTDFSEYFNVHSNNTKIDLKTLPIGDYIVQAIVGKKLIVMYLEKRKNVKISISFKEEKTIASEGESIKIGEKENILYYWVVSESNSNFGSTKTMKLEYKENVDKLISKNKLELKSEIGKNNKLLVYAIYNKSQFMTKQLRNSKYYKLVYDSKVFNVEPFYASEIKK